MDEVIKILTGLMVLLILGSISTCIVLFPVTIKFIVAVIALLGIVIFISWLIGDLIIGLRN